MRGAILLLVALMLALLGNIIAYSVSEDYRFFVKKIKYKQEVVYENVGKIDDSERIIFIEDEVQENINNSDKIIISKEWFTFLDALWIKEKSWENDENFPDLTFTEQEILEQLKEKFVLWESVPTTSLFDITTEYPDKYHEYSNKHVSLYIFSTKSYQQVYNIFDVLTYELPYTLNEANNFGEKSFYINLEGVYADEKVRIVFQYQNKTFWLKIKKDSYNIVKQILDELNAQ